MTQLKNAFARIAIVAFAAASWNVASAQDDLDDLLKELDGEQAQKAAAEKPAEEAGEEVSQAAAEESGTAATEEEAAGEKAEEAEAEAEEESAEEEAPAEETAEEEAEKPAEAEAPKASADEVLSLLDELAQEAGTDGAAVAAKDEAVKEEAKTEEAPAVQAAPVPQEPVAVAANPDAELLEDVVTTERLRRRALDTQAKREILAARKAMDAGEFKDAARRYATAQKLLNDRPDSKKLIRECESGMAEALYREALLEDRLGRRDRAKALMEKAIDLRHPKARRVIERWAAEGEQIREPADLTEISHRRNDADYKELREQIRVHLRRKRQYLAVKDMKRALEECEIVLVNDPYNAEAIRIRSAIEKKRQSILRKERVASRDGMIADVDEAWRPVYAVNASQISQRFSETVKTAAGEDPERTQEQEIEERMKAMRLPTISFKPPATILDAVEFFRQASKDYDRPDKPVEQRGFNFVLKTPQPLKMAASGDDEEAGSDDFSAEAKEDTATGPVNGLDPIPTITASDISFYEALKLVCDSVEYKFIVRGPVVMVMHKDMSTAELLSRKYDVLDAFLERMTSASSDVREMHSAGFGGGMAKRRGRDDEDEDDENQERDWKAFFEQMGVKWPEGSSIMYIKTLGKLYVRNTRENLAEFEKVLQEMGSQPKLIEIETRFVEVSQEDLNSLGFEWLLNNNYGMRINDRLGKALGISPGYYPDGNGTNARGVEKGTTTTTPGSTLPIEGQDVSTSSTGGGTRTGDAIQFSRVADSQQQSNGGWTRGKGARAIGLNSFGGTDATYGNGNRYLSTMGNHISGESKLVNDQFMRVNAFLGQADVSMILHMLSQRSDTDLLSAPKVVTKSGENAVIKVVTEYIYPQDYDVQLQSSSSSSSGGSSGGSQSAILAVVEPQNFTMREVGVILDVTPTYSEANGGTIDLELKPSVVDEPTWKNYGMKIPFSGNSSVQTFEGLAAIPGAAVAAIQALGVTLTDSQAQTYADAIMASSMDALSSSSGSGNMTWYDAPMEQPFFHVRSIDSKVSITPGATVVMGGLITEQRKAMDDKVPFLADIPYLGRLFRSHAEQTIKRNLLIFVTGRLITPSGRELSTVADSSEEEGEVKSAPAAEEE